MYTNVELLWKKNLTSLRMWLIKKLVGEGLDWNIEASLSLDRIVRYCPKGEVLCSLGPVNRLFPDMWDTVSEGAVTTRPLVVEWEVFPYNFKMLDSDHFLETGIAKEAA